MFLSDIGIPFKVDVGSKCQDKSLSGKVIITNYVEKINSQSYVNIIFCLNNPYFTYYYPSCFIQLVLIQIIFIQIVFIQIILNKNHVAFQI
jgi:hypothetical protein